MPRRNRRNRREPVVRRDARMGATRWTESGRQGDWTVMAVRGGDKTYVCPGCRGTIGVGVAHIVAWREDGLWGVDNRAHWHTPCWKRGVHRR